MILVNVYEGSEGECVMKLNNRWLVLPDLDSYLENPPNSMIRSTQLDKLREVADLAVRGRLPLKRELLYDYNPLTYRLQFYTPKR